MINIQKYEKIFMSLVTTQEKLKEKSQTFLSVCLMDIAMFRLKKLLKSLKH